MPTKGSETKAARIRKRDLEELERQMEGITFSEWVHRKINENREEKKEIREMCLLMGVGEEEFYRKIIEAMDEGEIVYKKGRIVNMKR